ncbi:MAG TPA: ABC transporter ATP-binding protein, partial [Mycobacteriales bacterium]|nr:ABC transporter ATP-binding protein [Mycobacteriales bacterium]
MSSEVGTNDEPQTEAAQTEEAVPTRGPGPSAGERRGPGAFMAGMSNEKPLDFRNSSKRLLRQMRPERTLVALTLLLACASVTLSVIGPKILGRATDLIFAGVVGKQLPAGTTQQQAAEGLRRDGQDKVADIVASMQHLVPGHGVDFNAVGEVLLWVSLIYIGSSLLGLAQGRLTTTIVQRSIYRMREDSQAKLARLPLSYFDKQPRGEVLSRVTNDIDNISQSLQQTMSQILSSILTVIGVLIMMLVISPLLALIAIIAVPLSIIL